MRPLPIPICSHVLTQSACMPKGLNHSSYLVSCLCTSYCIVIAATAAAVQQDKSTKHAGEED